VQGVSHQVARFFFCGKRRKPVLYPFVFVWIFFSFAASSFALEKGESKFRFVSFNLKNYQVGEPAGGSASRRGKAKPAQEVEAVLRGVSELAPDAIGVSEIGGREAVLDLWGRLKQAGLDLPYCTWVDSPSESRNLAFFSRHPIAVDWSRSEVPFELDGVKYFLRRGILDVALVLPGLGEVRFVGVHFKSRLKTREFDQEVYRHREARELRHHVSKILGEDEGARVVVWGDFNMEKNAQGFREVVSAFGKKRVAAPLSLEDKNGEVWTHYWESADIYSRIDYLFLSEDLAKKVDFSSSGIASFPDWFLASDHRPLYLTLRWKQKK